MVSTVFIDPQARSSDLGSLQPRDFEFLNSVETLDSTSNYYLVGGLQSGLLLEEGWPFIIVKVLCQAHTYV